MARLTLKTLITRRFKFQDEIDELEGKIKKIEKKFDTNEEKITKALREQGLERARNDKGDNVYFRKSVNPSITDWEKLVAYVKRYDAHQLFQRRISKRAWQELLDEGRVVPGVEKFTKVTLAGSRGKKTQRRKKT